MRNYRNHSTVRHGRKATTRTSYLHQCLANSCKKSIMDPIPHRQHRPICVQVEPVVVPQTTPFRRQFNLRKADWIGYATELDNKAAGRDGVLVDQLKNLGPNAHKWLRAMLNNCFIDNKIPTIWRQSKIIAILKPGKDSAVLKSY